MPDLVMAWDDVVALDYGQFLLRGVDEYDGDREMELLHQALTDDGVAADMGRVVVLSPHQNNFEMPLRVEVWSARPDDDAHLWEEAFESALRVGDGGLRYESPTLTSAEWPVPASEYHLAVTGRGFVSRGWPGSTRPGDWWRVRLWPGTGSIETRRVRRWEQPD